jgi:hypothetical protein
VMLLVVHPETAAGIPPKVTWLPEPWALKFVPAMVTADPIEAAGGLN